jgi:crossover junction endodeoxyribonuclease RuvC
MTENKKYRILGIDPGTNFLGYAILEVDGKTLNLIAMSTLALSHLDEQQEKLKRIFEKIDWVIRHFQPDQMAIEQPFFAKNVQSMLKLGRAQGVAIAAAINNNIPIEEYLPKEVKKSVAGNGNASKEQVAAMLGHILGRPIEPSYYDASDALALAVCHYYLTKNALGKRKKANSWASFLSENPKRVLK